MYKVAAVVVVLCLVRPSLSGTEPACPNGNYQKDTPSPESDLQSCNAYKCNSCCFPNITKQISITPLQQVGRLSYDQCSQNKTFSDACSKETSYLECFYQCSPNLYPWFGTDGKLTNLPICASFCEQWFQTCQNDLTCTDGRSWMTGLNKGLVDGNPVDPCKPGTKCRTYTEVYSNAQQLCDTMWSLGGYSLMRYTPDDQPCLIPSDPEHNAEVVRNLNSSYKTALCEEAGNYTDTGMIVGIVFGVLGGLFLIGAGVAFYLRTKKGKDKKAADKPKDTVATAEEMTTMKVETRQPDTPPNTRDASDVEEA